MTAIGMVERKLRTGARGAPALDLRKKLFASTHATLTAGQVIASSNRVPALAGADAKHPMRPAASFSEPKIQRSRHGNLEKVHPQLPAEQGKPSI